MFEHQSFRSLDHISKKDSVITAIGMVVILSLAIICALLIFF